MYKTHIALNTDKDVFDFVNICSKIPSEVIVHGEDENGNEWMLSAKSFLCSLVMRSNLHNRHKFKSVDYNTLYVESEDDIYSKISKFAI